MVVYRRVDHSLQLATATDKCLRLVDLLKWEPLSAFYVPSGSGNLRRISWSPDRRFLCATTDAA